MVCGWVGVYEVGTRNNIMWQVLVMCMHITFEQSTLSVIVLHVENELQYNTLIFAKEYD